VAVSDKEWITDETCCSSFTSRSSTSVVGRRKSVSGDEHFRAKLILRALENRWNVTATARYLGIP
jgi:hypothetical protein